MPIEIIDIDDGRGNIFICSGELTGKEYVDALRKHLAQDKNKFRNYRYSLIDYSAVTNFMEVPVSDIHLVAGLCKRAAQINSDAVIAIIADKEILFGLSRMWEMLVYGTTWEISVFRTRSAAETWLKETVKNKFGIEGLAMGST